MLPESKVPQSPNVSRSNQTVKSAGRGKQLRLINAALGSQTQGPGTQGRGGQQQPDRPRTGRGTHAERLRRARGKNVAKANLVPGGNPTVSAPVARATQHVLRETTPHVVGVAVARPHSTGPRSSNNHLKRNDLHAVRTGSANLKQPNQSLSQDGPKKPQKYIVTGIHVPTRANAVTQTQKPLPAPDVLHDRKFEIRCF